MCFWNLVKMILGEEIGVLVIVVCLEDEIIIFDLKGVDVSLVNVFRWLMIVDVLIVLIDLVEVIENFFVLCDEFLVYRLGLIFFDSIKVLEFVKFYEYIGDDDIVIDVYLEFNV